MLLFEEEEPPDEETFVFACVPLEFEDESCDGLFCVSDGGGV